MDTPPIKHHLDLRDWIALASITAIVLGGLVDIRSRIAIVETKLEVIREAQQDAKTRERWRDEHAKGAN